MFERVFIKIDKVGFSGRLLTIDNIEALKLQVELDRKIPAHEQRLFLIGKVWIELEDWQTLGDEDFKNFYQEPEKDGNLKTLSLHLVRQHRSKKILSAARTMSLTSGLQVEIDCVENSKLLMSTKVQLNFSFTVEDLASELYAQLMNTGLVLTDYNLAIMRADLFEDPVKW